MKAIFQALIVLFVGLPVFGQIDLNLFEETSNEFKNNTHLEGLIGEYTLMEVKESRWNQILNEHPTELTVEIPFNGELLEINLHEVTFFRDDLEVRTSSGQSWPIKEISKSIYYNGTFKGHPGSHFALSVLNNEIIGIGNIPGIGDVNLGKLIEHEEYVFFPESSVDGKNDFECKTEDGDLEHIEKDPGHDDHNGGPTRDLGDCVGLYFEADHDIFLDKGLVGTTDYITAMFNEIYLLYDADAMTVYLSDIMVWDTPSPYAGVSDTPTLLDLFGTVTPVWDGDLGHFVSYRGSGGLAWLDVFCHPDQALRKAVSDIDATFEAIPVFSWTIEVVAHEMGHNFGSPHTHACFWNGDMTAIDGCGPTAGYPEGCTAPLPASGTIMSYCHLVGGVGIDLGLGFGVQPGDHIRQEIIDATCLDGCDLNPFMDVEVELVTLVSSACDGDSVFAEATLLHHGNDTLTSIDILMYVDGVLEETIAWTGSLPEDSSEVVPLPGVLLPLGTHTILVRVENPNGVEDNVDGNNEFELTFEVTGYPDVVVTDFTNISCFGADDGTIDIDVSGGTPGYTFEWDNGGGTDEDPVGLAANTYTLTLTDDAGCQVELLQELTQPDEIIVDATVTENPDCFPDATGEATVTASGGSPGYTYLWSSGGTGTTETGLVSGEYVITVTDANDCDATDTINIVSPPELIVDSVIVQAGCGMDNGEIQLTVSGGTPGYAYDWSTGAVTEDLTDLFTGTYTLTITDDNGCLVDLEYFVPEDAAPELSLESIIHIDCFGDEVGSIVVSGTNIDGVAEYTWSTGDTGTDLTGVGSGDYTVTLSDDSNCEDVETYTVVENPEIIIDPVITGISCYGDTDGEIIVAVDGGIPGYTYEWSTGAVTAGIDDLGPGTYTITITDELDCVQELEIELIEPDTLSIDGVFSDEICDGENGSVELTVDGGTPGYTYAWSTGETTSSIDGLAAGIYNVLVTDENGCTGTYGVILENVDNFEAEISNTHVLCFGGNDATGTVDIISGTSPYTYEWSDGQVTPTAVDLEAGTYTVTVTDANGCIEEFEILVEQPDEIEVASSISNEVFGDDGEITVTVIGGVPDYTYLWNTGETTEDISGLAGGIYTLIVTDENGCEVEFVFEVGSQLSLEDFGEGLFKVYPNPATTELRISNSSDKALNSIRLYNSIGQIVLDQTPETFGEHIIDVSYFASGVYYVVLDVEGQLVKTKILIEQ